MHKNSILSIETTTGKTYLLIYVLLLIAQFRLTDTSTAPPMILRLVYWVLAIYPAILHPKLMPGIIALFYTITIYWFAYGYMPYENYWYILFVIPAIVVSTRNRKNHFIIPRVLVYLMLYTLVINFIFDVSISSLSTILLLIIALLYLSDRRDVSVIKMMSVGFCVATILLSIGFLMMKDQYVREYAGVWERSGWIDPNYFGMVLCLGGICALFELFKGDHMPLLEKWFYIITLLLAIPVLIINASRGAVLAIGGSGLVLLLFSKTKMINKVLLILMAAVFLIVLYKYDLFELLLYRINNDNTGTGRLEIWMVKLDDFFQQPFYNIVFGLGDEGGLQLGADHITLGTVANGKLGFHNDFIGFLVKYGIIGFILFLIVLFYPFRFVNRQSNKFPIVLSGIIAISLYSFSLEPYSSGGTSFWLFYMYVLMISMNDKYMI